MNKLKKHKGNISNEAKVVFFEITRIGILLGLLTWLPSSGGFSIRNAILILSVLYAVLQITATQIDTIFKIVNKTLREEEKRKQHQLHPSTEQS